jgi:hypothetical protein
LDGWRPFSGICFRSPTTKSDAIDEALVENGKVGPAPGRVEIGEGRVPAFSADDVDRHRAEARVAAVIVDVGERAEARLLGASMQVRNHGLSSSGSNRRRGMTDSTRSTYGLIAAADQPRSPLASLHSSQSDAAGRIQKQRLWDEHPPMILATGIDPFSSRQSWLSGPFRASSISAGHAPWPWAP